MVGHRGAPCKEVAPRQAVFAQIGVTGFHQFSDPEGEPLEGGDLQGHVNDGFGVQSRNGGTANVFQCVTVVAQRGFEAFLLLGEAPFPHPRIAGQPYRPFF